MSKKKIYKPRPISGFPEFLPEVRLVEQRWLDHIRRIFESYGFCSLETPAVEELDVIAAKGEDVDKEIYVLERLQADPDDEKEARLAQHFDQTVPMARYVAQHFNELIFPFKRYQMQKVWRGERPQAGRFREFMQCDIDVINVDNLPLHFDAEIPAIIWEVLSSLPGMENEKIQIRISNRKIFVGMLEALVIDKITEALRVVDKVEKIGHDKATEYLKTEAHVDKDQASIIMGLSRFKSSDPEEIRDFIKSFGLKNPLMEEGIDDLCFVMDNLRHLPEGAAVANLSIVRGLDYYTGTVYETVFTDDPGYGSICSGGRYDDLAGSYINKHLPGVGISIGLTRLFDRLLQQGKLPVGPTCPAEILVVMPTEERRSDAMKAAQDLRKRGLKVENFHGPSKLKRQLSYAEKKSIPYVWFPPFEDGQDHEVKNMKTGEQVKADPQKWIPDSKKETLDDVA